MQYATMSLAPAALTALGYLAWVYALLYSTMTAHYWYVTLRKLGLSSLRLCPKVLWLSLRTKPVRMNFLLLLSILAAIFLLVRYGANNGYSHVLPFIVFFSAQTLPFTSYLRPPTALVLTSSTDRQTRWALGLGPGMRFHRVVSLLDTGHIKHTLDASNLWEAVSRRSLTLTDVLRTADTRTWREAIRQLVELTPVIILDARECTPAILYEAGLVLSPEHVYKAIFVSENDGRCPVIERLLAEGHAAPDRMVSVVREEQLQSVLKEWAKSEGNLPQPGRFILAPKSLGEIAAAGGASLAG